MKAVWLAIWATVGLLSAAPAIAQTKPSLPVASSYEDCDAFSDRYSAYLAEVREAQQSCLSKLTPQQNADDVVISCNPLSWPRACSIEVERSSCAHKEQMGLLATCRANVKRFLGEQGTPVPEMSDYRDGLLSSYFEDATSFENMLPAVAEDFSSRVTQLKTAVGNGSPDPATVLRYGKDFASSTFAATGPNDLAQALFDSASQGVAAGGQDAVDQATDALNAFESNFVRKSYPVEVQPTPAVEASTVEPEEAPAVESAPLQSKPKKKPKKKAAQNSCGWVPGNMGGCFAEGARYCQCTNGKCTLGPDYAGCSIVGAIIP